MKLILTGVTGGAGSQIFKDAVADQSITQITVLTRRALPDWLPKSNKTNTIILDDFLNYPPELPSVLAGHDACIWALGVSSVGISEEDYTKITYGYTEALVKALIAGGVAEQRQGKPPFQFAYISGLSADESSPTMFRRVKGRTDNYLLNLPAESGIKGAILRPGYFFPSQKELIVNTRSMTDRVLSKVLKPAMSGLKPQLYIPIESLSGFAIKAVKGEWGTEQLFSNQRMRELMGLNEK